MTNKYGNIGLWVEDATKAREFVFLPGRFDEDKRIFSVLDKNNQDFAFPLRFDYRKYFYHMLFRVVLNFATGTITPEPMAITYADPFYATDVGVLVKAAVTRMNMAAEGLKLITERVTSALDTKAIPPALYQEVEQAKMAYLDTPINFLQDKAQIHQVHINLLEGGARIIHPIRMRAGNRAAKVSSRVDSGAEMCVISPELANKLRAPVVDTVELCGFTGGNEVVPVIEIEVTVAKNHMIKKKAAVSRRVKQQTGKDFLVGADLIIEAKNAGESML